MPQERLTDHRNGVTLTGIYGLGTTALRTLDLLRTATGDLTSRTVKKKGKAVLTERYGPLSKVLDSSAVRLKNDTLEHTHGNPAHKAQSLSPYNAEGLRYLAVWLAGLFTEGVGFCAAGESVSPVIDFGARLLGRHRLLLLLHHHEGTAADEQEAHDRANDDADERPRGEPVVRRRRAVVALVRRLRQSSVCIKPR